MPSGTRKFCKDCKHFAESSYWEQAMCLNPKMFEVNPVWGEHPMAAAICRMTFGPCSDANGWEPKDAY
jgi:hypothetical protein